MLTCGSWGDDEHGLSNESTIERLIADYIADMTAELAVMAAWAEHTDLARILEMARLQSEQICGLVQNVAEEPALGDMSSDMADGVSAKRRLGRTRTPDRLNPTNVIRLSALRAAQR